MIGAAVQPPDSVLSLPAQAGRVADPWVCELTESVPVDDTSVSGRGAGTFVFFFFFPFFFWKQYARVVVDFAVVTVKKSAAHEFALARWFEVTKG